MEMIQSQFAPAAQPPPLMEIPPPPQQGGGGMNPNTMQSLMGLGKAMGSKMSGGEAEEEMYDSPMPRMKRPFQTGPPTEMSA